MKESTTSLRSYLVLFVFNATVTNESSVEQSLFIHKKIEDFFRRVDGETVFKCVEALRKGEPLHPEMVSSDFLNFLYALVEKSKEIS